MEEIEAPTPIDIYNKPNNLLEIKEYELILNLKKFTFLFFFSKMATITKETWIIFFHHIGASIKAQSYIEEIKKSNKDININTYFKLKFKFNK